MGCDMTVSERKPDDVDAGVIIKRLLNIRYESCYEEDSRIRNDPPIPAALSYAHSEFQGDGTTK